MSTFEELKHLPRHTRGSIELNGISFQYNDPLAFYNEYTDIFINGIYRFASRAPSPIILDVGGYIGLSAIYFKILFPGARVMVFEPDPFAFEMLQNNVRGAGLPGVTLFNAGVGKDMGKLPFYPDGADGGNFIVRRKGSPLEVDMVRLSDYITGPVELLKMNIEGMEGDVFEEIEHKLSFIKEIIFEYHAFHCLPQNLGKILAILERSGFRYLVADVPCARTPVPFKMGRGYKYFNLINAAKVEECPKKK
jgi:FkbM family methyltransferase